MVHAVRRIRGAGNGDAQRVEPAPSVAIGERHGKSERPRSGLRGRSGGQRCDQLVVSGAEAATRVAV